MVVESKGLRGVRPRPIDREPVGVVRAAGFVRAVHDYHMTRSRRMHCESYANVGVFSVMPSQLCMRWSLDDRRARLSRDADAGGEPAARRPSGVSVCLSLRARVCVCVCVAAPRPPAAAGCEWLRRRGPARPRQHMAMMVMMVMVAGLFD